MSYRYTLTRSWANSDLFAPALAGRLCWVMLNPSTADDVKNDATTTRCINFSRDNGYASLILVNLFAVRTPDPAILRTFDDPVGPDNETLRADAIASSDAVVVAWGASVPKALGTSQQSRTVMACLLSGHSPLCLGRTAAGHPRHPLYVKANQPLIPFTTSESR